MIIIIILALLRRETETAEKKEEEEEGEMEETAGRFMGDREDGEIGEREKKERGGV